MKNISNQRKYSKGLDNKLNTVGTNILFRRKNLKYSRAYLSDKLMFMGIDICSQAIYDIENGKRTVLDYELCAIAKALETTSDELLKDFKSYLDSF